MANISVTTTSVPEGIAVEYVENFDECIAKAKKLAKAMKAGRLSFDTVFYDGIHCRVTAQPHKVSYFMKYQELRLASSITGTVVQAIRFNSIDDAKLFKTSYKGLLVPAGIFGGSFYKETRA